MASFLRQVRRRLRRPAGAFVLLMVVMASVIYGAATRPAAAAGRGLPSLFTLPVSTVLRETTTTERETTTTRPKPTTTTTATTIPPPTTVPTTIPATVPPTTTPSRTGGGNRGGTPTTTGTTVTTVTASTAPSLPADVPGAFPLDAVQPSTVTTAAPTTTVAPSRPAAHKAPSQTTTIPAAGGYNGTLTGSGGGWKGVSLTAATDLKVPIAFALGVAVFIMVQALIDRRDPKLSRAPERGDDDTVGFK